MALRSGYWIIVLSQATREWNSLWVVQMSDTFLTFWLNYRVINDASVQCKLYLYRFVIWQKFWHRQSSWKRFFCIIPIRSIPTKKFGWKFWSRRLFITILKTCCTRDNVFLPAYSIILWEIQRGRIGHGDRSLRSFENNYFITKFSAEARHCGTFFCRGKLRGLYIEDEVFHGAYEKHEANGKIQFAANLIRSPRSDLYYEKARLYLLIKLNSVLFCRIPLLFTLLLLS